MPTTDARSEVALQDTRTVDDRIVDSSRQDSPGDGSDGVQGPDAATTPDASDDVADVRSDVLDAGSNPTDVSSADAGLDAVVLTDAVIDTAEACALNACGGCGPLGAAPNTPCGQCGTYVCAPDKLSVMCNDPGYVKYKSVSVGGLSTCGLLTTGGVRCWGANQTENNPDLTPPGSDFLGGVQSISTGWHFSRVR